MLRLFSLVTLIILSACAMADDHPRTITVTGTGTASTAPDRAIVNMSIVAREPTLAAAQSAAGKVTSSVLDMTRKLGIAKDKVDTTGSSVRADYRYNRKTEEQELRGYIAERQMVIDVRDLEILGEVVEGAVAAGVNQVSPPQLDSGKRRDAYRDALANAADDARENAKTLAKELGAKLGKAMQVNTGSQARPPAMPMARMAMADSAESGSAQTYNAGDLSFSATVTVVFELLD